VEEVDRADDFEDASGRLEGGAELTEGGGIKHHVCQSELEEVMRAGGASIGHKREAALPESLPTTGREGGREDFAPCREADRARTWRAAQACKDALLRDGCAVDPTASIEAIYHKIEIDRLLVRRDHQSRSRRGPVQRRLRWSRICLCVTLWLL